MGLGGVHFRGLARGSAPPSWEMRGQWTEECYAATPDQRLDGDGEAEYKTMSPTLLVEHRVSVQ